MPKQNRSEVKQKGKENGYGRGEKTEKHKEKRGRAVNKYNADSFLFC